MAITTSEPGFTLHKLRHDDFHIICGLTGRTSAGKPDAHVGPALSHIKVGDAVVAEDGFKGTVSGFAVENDIPTQFARVNGRLYHVNVLKRAK